MKIYKKKLIKGFFGIFVIKFMFVFSMFVIQSCQNEEVETIEQTFEQKNALAKFENLVKSTTPKIDKFIKRHNIQLDDVNENVFIYNKSLTEAEAQEIMQPLVQGTKELFMTFGLNQNDFSEEFDDVNDTRIALAGIAFLYLSSDSGNEVVFNFTNVFVQSTNAQITVGEVIGCVLESLGLNIGWGLAHNIAQNGLKVAKKLLRSAALRIAGGPIGATITIAQFSYCMYLAYNN